MQDSVVNSSSMVAEGLKYPENPTSSGVVPQGTPSAPTSVQVPTGDIVQQSTPTNEQPQSREAYFQKNWDALTNVVKEYGLELSPSDTPNYGDIFKPYFESHKVVEYMNSNPQSILDLAQKYFPDQVTRPSFDQEVQSIITQEFGEDFTPLSEDLYRFGTESYKYRTRIEAVEKEIQAREINKIRQQETEALQRQETMRTEFNNQYAQAKSELNLTDEQIKPYVDKIISGDPRYSTMANMIKLVMMVDGSMEVVPKTLDSNFIPSLGSMSGGPSTGKPQTLNEWAGV